MESTDMAKELAYTTKELAYTRYQVAKLEHFIRTGVKRGHITIPDKTGPSRQVIDAILGKENHSG